MSEDWRKETSKKALNILIEKHPEVINEYKHEIELLKADNEELMIDANDLKKQNEKIQKDNDELKIKNNQLRAENDKLKGKVSGGGYNLIDNIINTKPDYEEIKNINDDPEISNEILFMKSNKSSTLNIMKFFVDLFFVLLTIFLIGLFVYLFKKLSLINMDNSKFKRPFLSKSGYI